MDDKTADKINRMFARLPRGPWRMFKVEEPMDNPTEGWDGERSTAATNSAGKLEGKPMEHNMGGVELTWEEIARELWKLLDNIDTAGDMAKGDDKLFRAIVEREHVKRCLYMESPDGYRLEPRVRIKDVTPFAQARAVMVRELRASPQFWKVYRDNVAMALYDAMGEVMREAMTVEKRNEVAEAVMQVLFTP